MNFSHIEKKKILPAWGSRIGI